MSTELDVFGEPMTDPGRYKPGRRQDSPEWATAEDLALWLLIPEILTERQYLHFCEWFTRTLGREPVVSTQTLDEHARDCRDLCVMRYRTRHMDRATKSYAVANTKLLSLALLALDGSRAGTPLTWGAHEILRHYTEKRIETPDVACTTQRLGFLLDRGQITWKWVREETILTQNLRPQPDRASVEFDELYHPLVQFLGSPGDPDSVRATASALRQAARAVFSRPC